MINARMEVALAKRKSKHIEDGFGIQECWNEMVAILSENEENTIEYLRNCPASDMYWISEVFEDISENLQSQQFIKLLRELDIKYPELEMTADIDLAEEYLGCK